MVPSVRRSTVADRAFSVAGPRVWNTLPEEITTSQWLLTFRQQLKTWLFRKSYPDIMWTRICLNFTINLEVVLLLRQFLIDWLTLASLHWLRFSECIQYKLATTVSRWLHGLASPYVFDDLHHFVDIPSRRRLRSASSLQLDVSHTPCHTIAAAGPTLWNSLPPENWKLLFSTILFPWLHFSF